MNICRTLPQPRPVKPYHLIRILILCPSPFKAISRNEQFLFSAFVERTGSFCIVAKSAQCIAVLRFISFLVKFIRRI